MTSKQKESRAILVTGGAGFIGSHAVVALARAGWRPVVVDNFSNSSKAVLPRLAQLCGFDIPWVEADVQDRAAIRSVLDQHGINSVIHFAGLKAVGESVAQPLRYYQVNVGGLMSLLQAMAGSAARTLVFSSSATVYGQPESSPIPEGAPLQPANPYGWSKVMCEQVLHDAAAAEGGLRIAILRYFNPVGADASGLIGEDPRGVPNNLMPFVCQVAGGQRSVLRIFGKDYPTPDGTALRDYIHVSDLAEGHVAALRFLESCTGASVFNLGTGQPCSVLQVAEAFRRASGEAVPAEFAPRRAGDVPAYWADPRRAKELLNWEATRGLADMCADAWRWQQANPRGYAS